MTGVRITVPRRPTERQETVAPTGETVDTPQVEIILALHNEFKRFGLERMCAVAGLGQPVSVQLLGDRLPRPAGVLQVLITDLRDLDDLRVAARAADHRGEGGQVLLIVGGQERDIARATELDCDGYLDESSLDAETLADAVRQLMHGQVPMPARMVQVLFSRISDRTVGSESAPPALTERESEVIALLVAGYSNKQIARRIGASAHATKRAVASIMAKLNCPNRTVVAARALRDGLCPPRATVH